MLTEVRLGDSETVVDQWQGAEERDALSRWSPEVSRISAFRA